MREIHKTLTLHAGREPHTFRLHKLDAFSGAQLLQLVRKHLPKTPESGTTLLDAAELILVHRAREQEMIAIKSCSNL